MTQFRLDHSFRAGFCVWTESAPWIIGVVATIDWSVEGACAITAKVAIPDDRDYASREYWKDRITEQPMVKRQETKKYMPMAPADAAGIEVWPPGNLSHMARRTY